jgi:imidazolonepropionase-like amidohydrolase
MTPDRALHRWDLAVWGLACLLLPLMACAVAGSPGPAAESASQATAFVGVNVMPMTGGLLRDQTVLVEGDRIATVGPRGKVALPAGARIVEGAGRYLLPGLADMHVHLEYFDAPAILGLFLANGVTTVRNMDGRPYILEWKRRVAAGELLGPSIHTAGPLLDGNPPRLPDNTVVRDAAEARAAVLAQADAGYDFIKVYTNLSPEAWRAVLAAARERGLPVAGHVPQRVDLAEVLAAGQTIEHLTDYGDWIEADDSPFRDRWHWSKLYLAMPVDGKKVDSAAGRIAQSGVWTVPTMVQAERALAPAETLSAWLAAPEMAYIPADGRAEWEGRVRRSVDRMDAEDWTLVERGAENRRRLAAALRAAGARLLVGTDTPNPFVVPDFSVHEELENFVAAGYTPEEALAAATREAARFLGELDEWGTVEAGKRADLVLLEANPLEAIGNTRRPVGVMVRGRWFPKDELQSMLASLLTARPASRRGEAVPPRDRESFFPQLAPATGERAFPEALVEGTLTLSDGCLRIVQGDAVDYLIIWPPHVRLEVSGGSVRVLDEERRTTAQVGGEVRLGGGEVQISAPILKELRHPLPDECPGPYWLASGILASQQ